MNSQDKKPFLDAMMAMGELYNRELSTTLVSMYFDDLTEYSLPRVLEAMRKHRLDSDSGSFFPKPSDLIEKLSGGSREQAVMAWVEVRLLASNSRIAKSENPITEAVVAQMGGWRKLGLTDVTEFQWLEKEFTERYQILSKRPELVEEAMVKIKSNVTKMFPSNDH